MTTRPEDEARKTWCPFASVAAMVQTAPGQGVVVPVNRSVGALQKAMMHPGTECMGSDCALWVARMSLEGQPKVGECALARDSSKAWMFNS